MTGSPARIEGTLTSWDDDRGFGFLTPTSGRGRAFVHITAFGRGTARPRLGETFSYEVDRHGDRGPAAVRVAAVGSRWSAPRARAPRPTRSGTVALVVGLVVTLGAAGVVAVDSSTGEEVVAPPVRVRAVDATGAGDVFCAALAVASLEDRPLRERIDLAALVAAITVSRPGGASTAPRRDELAPWLAANPAAADPDRYGFVTTSLPVATAEPADRTH